MHDKKEKTKNEVQSSVQQKKFRTQNVVQTVGQEIRAFALPCSLGRFSIAYCAKIGRQFWLTRKNRYTTLLFPYDIK